MLWGQYTHLVAYKESTGFSNTETIFTRVNLLYMRMYYVVLIITRNVECTSRGLLLAIVTCVCTTSECNVGNILFVLVGLNWAGKCL